MNFNVVYYEKGNEPVWPSIIEAEIVGISVIVYGYIYVKSIQYGTKYHCE